MTLKRGTPAPKATSGRTNWPAIFDEIRQEPWVWADLGSYPMSYVPRIKAGVFAGSVEGEFEATIRDSDRSTQRGTLWVRYIDAPKPEGIDE